MKRKVLAFLLAVCMLPVTSLAAFAEADGELVFKPDTPTLDRDEEKSEFDSLKDLTSSLVESLGNKQWETLADEVRLSGNWRNDLMELAKSQVGYAEEKSGMTYYTRWAGIEEPVDWSAIFVAWAADYIGLDEKKFPQAFEVDELIEKMSKVNAYKRISRANYPNYGDIAVLELKDEQGKEYKLAGIIVHISDDDASIVHGDSDGRVVRRTYRVNGAEFKRYIDLNVLMARAGIDTGKGGEVPQIPEGGIAGWTTATAVYIRKEPTIASKALANVAKAKTALLVTGAQKQSDGYIWYAVEYNNIKGYIRGDLMDIDTAALPTPTPVPTPVPEVTPIPGCAICRKASMGIAMPEDCCYEQLTAMSQSQLAVFMADLMKDDPTSFVLYLSCVSAHVAQGAADVLCLGEDCGAAAWSKPSPEHAADCPWHKDGLSAQERVINIEIREARKGQELMISHEVYGASAYQWYEIKAVTTTDEYGGSNVTETETALEGENAASLIVTAKSEANTAYSYYCEATVYIGNAPFVIRSKTTAVAVDAIPAVASALLGEEVNFTYTFDGAASYQWYIVEETETGKTDAPIEGETAARLTFRATRANSGKLYFAKAFNANGGEIGASGYFCYKVVEFITPPNAFVCDEEHQLCRYVEELAQMTREERYIAMTQTWFTETVEGETVTPNNCLAEYVYFHWLYCHSGIDLGLGEPLAESTVYPHLLCSCDFVDDNFVQSKEGFQWAHPYDEQHHADCAWYITPGQEAINTTERVDQEEFDKWCETATEKMILRAMTVPTLDHAVLEQNEDGTYAVYIARYEAAVGRVDNQGYLHYGEPSLVIAWINFTTGKLYPMSALPENAPALDDSVN